MAADNLFDQACAEVAARSTRMQKNIDVLGADLFNYLPEWAKALDWVLGALPRGDYGRPQTERQYIALTQVGNKGCFNVVGEQNFLMGECDCCSSGEAEVKAYAFLDIPDYTIPGVEPLQLRPLWPSTSLGTPGPWRAG